MKQGADFSLSQGDSLHGSQAHVTKKRAASLFIIRSSRGTRCMFDATKEMSYISYVPPRWFLERRGA
jgi:hypothetical protein